MNIIVFIILSAIGLALGTVFGHPLIGIGIGIFLSILINRQGAAPLNRDTMKLVEQRTNSYLTEVWATLPALKRIEASDPAYALANLQDIFALHFPDELQREIQTAEEIFDLGKIIVVSEVKPLKQMQAFLKHGRKGIFRKNQDVAATVLHAGRIYARAAATPAMLQWLEAWSRDMGINTDIAYRGYLDEIHEQDGTQVQRLIDDSLQIDQRLDEIPVVLADRAAGNSHNLASRNTLYAELRKGISRHKMRAA